MAHSGGSPCEADGHKPAATTCGVGRDPARAVIAAIFELLPHDEGDMLMGERCPKRSLHTFKSACREYQLTPGQLESFAKGTPGLAFRLSGRSEDILISRPKADRLFLGRTPFIGTWTLATMHGRAAPPDRGRDNPSPP